MRGGDRGDRPTGRPSRPATRHDRPRRRRLHHAHPADRRLHHCTNHVRKDLLHDRPRPPRARGSRPLQVRLGRLRRSPAPPRKRGLSEEVVRNISALKNEPEWMLEHAAQGPAAVRARSRCRTGAPTCPASTSTTSSTSSARRRSRRPPGTTSRPDIKNTYDKLGIPEAEKQRLVSGVAAQYESEVVYHQIREDLEQQGVIFLDTDTALREQRETVPRVLRDRRSRPATTSSPRSTPRCGRAARSSTSRRACTSTSRCRPTSGSTPRTWASSSGR